MRRFGLDWGLSDVPTARSSHRNVTPKGGGVGILLAFLVACLNSGVSPAYWIPVAAIALLGLASDLFDIKPQRRLIAHFIIAGFLTTNLMSDGEFPSIVVALATVLFLVGTANFFNFMDGINGIAAVSAIVAFGLLAGAGAIKSLENGFVEICLGLAAASAGFLPFNLPSARVFMGDVGSLLLGLVFGSMVIWASSGLLDAIGCAGFLLPFYVDEFNTMVVRMRRGEKLWNAHRRHLYQVLANEVGLAHWKVTLAYGSVQLVFGGVILGLIQTNREAAALASVIGFAVLCVTYNLLYKRFSSPAPPPTGRC